ncbi:DHA2 family efflux MFS transporter permease subunit [Terriglobus roseus]|uniref:MFS transporter, DHA2 family, multidrug resistance protein n=1 Tax=Terriglobus roseus TaxID=392734 RepID=A0A1H4PXU5_9BACT|nr:DHA2 family efflux MFS transporter permease subunit [Terriglobus roseus]SEC12206.1 MFS transporter, DHA2 family, multidrug resistance protein [Terriglobus roseus]
MQSSTQDPEIESHPFEDAADRAEAPLAPSAARFEPGVPLETQAPPVRVFNPWIIALVVTMGTFMEVLDTSIANVALPHIAGSLSASQDESTWVLTSYLVANAIILPISGWISSVIGRKNFYLISVVMFTVFSAACGIAPTLGALVVFRVLQGLSGGGLQPSVQAILADAFPGEKRGMAMAVYTVAILCAPVLGPTLGGWITDNYSWRWIFYINIPVGVLCAIFTRMVLVDPPHLTAARKANKGKKIRIDGTGLALVSIGLAATEIVLDRGQELDWFGSTFITWTAIVAGIAIVGAIAWELYTPNPVVNLRLLKERNFLFCCTIVLGMYTALYASTFLLPQYMQELMGYDATTAGLAVSPAGLVTMLEVPFVGWLMSRGSDARRLIAMGIITMTAGTYWCSLLNLSVGEHSLVWPRIVQVMGLGMTTVPLSTIMFRFLPADQSSNAAGIYALVRNEGGSIGIALSSTFLQRTTQQHQTYLAANISASNPLAMQAVQSASAAVGGDAADRSYAGLAMVYHQVQTQASLLAYMDQFRLFAYVLACLLPLVLLLKRPPKIIGKITLDAH